MSGDKTLNCLRCGGGMEYVKREYIQLGKTGWLLGDWPNLAAGGLYVDIWHCPDCGKLEFFSAESIERDGEYEEGHMAQTTCPACGREHDLDDPKCPYCGAKNPSI